ncbi:hypothetical protein [Helicobacter typhlonius]|uniref:Outer membrane protein beta-barrel domain-containing protein n=4 Tax=Helicobacter typhlonius TaxID=76936 RepID=A0A099UHT5_9HELI|nr:hypothetical protein [Helicobacter typhlonius]TLD79143.1 hypothetical protein LS75_002255 [Helicobacter typhlonius]CUU40474.1 Hypothetical protein BN2458_PEG1591 [Helicobacter typhlonius]HCD73737.1 hypothetical protein [Helicobacter sp.]
MKKLILLLCVLGNVCVAKDFAHNRTFSFGVYARTGAPMGAGLEFSFPLIKGEIVEWRNFISIEGFGLKLIDSKYDSAALLFNEKMVLSYLAGSNVVSAMGVTYFRPYLFISGGYALTGGKYNNFGEAPYYIEVSGGIGHEFISQNGHTFFFEFGGGSMFYSQALLNQRQTKQAITKVLLGYRKYF